MKIGPQHQAAYTQLLPQERSPDARRLSDGRGLGQAVALDASGTDRVNFSADANIRRAQETLQNEIGKQLSEQFEKAGFVLADDVVGIDWSPQATAKRIFDFSIGLFGIWRKNQPPIEDSELIKRFEETLRSAVDRGHGEAMKVLSKLGLEEGARPAAQETMHELHGMFDAHFAALRDQRLQSQSADPTEPRNTGTSEHKSSELA